MLNSKWKSMKSAISKKYNAPLDCVSYDRESGVVRVNNKGFALYDEPKNELYRFGSLVSFDC